MKKLGKLKLNQISQMDLNEREMCRLLGGGTPGCCQCGCNYTSSTSSNDSANNAVGKYSDTRPQCSNCSCPPPPPQTFCNCNDGTVVSKSYCQSSCPL